MKAEYFQQVVDFRVKEINRVLGVKAFEYARSNDRLSNFKRAAAMLNQTPEAALLGMMSKHTVSIMDMIDDIPTGRFSELATWREKIGDHINYLILLEALIEERVIEKLKEAQ